MEKNIKSLIKRKSKDNSDILISVLKKKKFKKESEVLSDEEVTTENADNKGKTMMVKMGWKGKGLGAQDQGREEPVEASTHMFRHGLGLTVEDLGIEKPETIWIPELDEASATGDLVFTLTGERFFLDDHDLISEMEVGDRLESIDDESNFCDQNLLHEMLKCKTVLDQHGVIIDGRARSNPYEKIGACIFLNRAALKMANLDYVSKGLFTNSVTGETLFFADICAGPGGFTEYMLWRRPMDSCGFGFTLKGPCDFKIRDIICGPVECFHPSYGINDDGDIFNEDNLKKFQQEVLSSTDGIGVNTVLADGGFSVEGKENIQEILSKQLYLCQFLCAINILRIGGSFVCKLFDTFTDFTVGLIHIMCSIFLKVSIIKPITSRPANSERYIIFEDLVYNQKRLESIKKYFYYVNNQLTVLKELDVIKLVSPESFDRDPEFIEFIKDSNNKILSQQILALAKLHVFVMERNLIDDRQMDIRTAALKLWKVPDISRDVFKSIKAPESVKKFVIIDNLNVFGGLKLSAKKSITNLTEEEFSKDKFVLRNHYAGFVSRSCPELMKHTLYVIIKDKRFIMWYPQNLDRKPEKITETIKRWSISIPSFSILLVHFGTEFSGYKGNIKYNSITIVDAALIYNEDISMLDYKKRMEKVKHLCCLLDPKHKGHIKPLDFFPLISIFDILKESLSFKKAKGVKEQEMISISKGDHFFPPEKLIILNFIKEPWMIALSKSTGNTYYYNVNTKTSVEKIPPNMYASYCESSIFEVDWIDQSNTLQKQTFLRILSKKAA